MAQSRTCSGSCPVSMNKTPRLRALSSRRWRLWPRSPLMVDWPTRSVEECLTKLRLGSLKKLQTQDYRPSGRFPVIDQGQVLIAGWTDDDSGLIEQGLPVVVFGDHTRAF